MVDGSDVGLDVGIRGGQDFAGGEVGDYGSSVEEDDAVGEVEGFVEVVGDEEGGFAEAGEEVAEGGLEFGAGDGVECAEGLVEEEDGGVRGEGAGEADALALTAGELPRVAGGEFGGDRGRRGSRLSETRAGLGVFGEFEGETGVAGDGHVGEEAGLLDDVAGGAAEADEARGVERGDVYAGVEDAAGGGADQPVDCAEEGGFAGAGAAEEGRGSGGFEGEGDVAEDGAGVWKDVADVVELDAWLGHPWGLIGRMFVQL